MQGIERELLQSGAFFPCPGPTVETRGSFPQKSARRASSSTTATLATSRPGQWSLATVLQYCGQTKRDGKSERERERERDRDRERGWRAMEGTSFAKAQAKTKDRESARERGRDERGSTDMICIRIRLYYETHMIQVHAFRYALWGSLGPMQEHACSMQHARLYIFSPLYFPFDLMKRCVRWSDPKLQAPSLRISLAFTFRVFFSHSLLSHFYSR
jgi:hypothetical protein